jgi:P27 family predicted phage terminase small subunit
VTTPPPGPPPRRLDPPPHYDEGRRATWADAVGRLADAGGIFRADPAVLNAYVEAVAAHTQASQLLAQTNVLITRNGTAVENPALSVQRRAADALAKAAKSLGLDRTPMTAAATATTLGVALAAADRPGGRWCDRHSRLECTHHRRRCGHAPGLPPPPGGCCHEQAVTGTAACYHHAGKSLAAAKAEGRAAIARFTAGPAEVTPAEGLLAEVRRSAGHVAALGAMVADLEQREPESLWWGVAVEREEGGMLTGRERRAGPHVLVRQYDAERDRFAKVCAAAITAGAVSAAGDAARALGGHLAALLDVIFAGLELSDRQRDVLVPVVVPAAIRAWDPEAAGA